ncbi:hypothetical protein [Gallaecimonas pentaromativorans]|uniref:hypothetical protein n=1 Tax=Gallaecimonas pentaromativorans TaxID=584787 RepID=UPI003A93E530
MKLPMPLLLTVLLAPAANACTLAPVKPSFTGTDIASVTYQQGIRQDSEEPFIRALVLYKDSDMAVVESRSCEMENYSVNYFSTQGGTDSARIQALLAPSPLSKVTLAKPLLAQLPKKPGLQDLSDDVTYAQGQVELLVSNQSLDDALTPFRTLVSVSIALGGAD